MQNQGMGIRRVMTIFTKGEKKLPIREELSVDAKRLRIENDDGLETIEIDFSGMSKADETRIRTALASKQFSENM